jgi:hypothetical protein
MRWLIVALSFVLPGLAQAACAPTGTPWISMEVIAGEPAGNEPALWIEVRRDRCVTVRFASWDLRRGVYQYELDDGQVSSLAQRVSSTGMDTFDAGALKARLAGEDRSRRNAAVAAGKATSIFTVSDGDSYRIEVTGDTTKNLIAWYAPREEAGFRPNTPELGRLVSFIDAVRALAASEQRVKIGEVQP